MPARLKLNRSYKEKKERIKKLPVIGNLVMSGMRKKDAYEFVQIFHDGIKENKFGLRKLQPQTVSAKRGLGYDLPGVPLYGKGDREKKRSYVNMLRIKKLKNGWKVFPSWGKHHKSNLKLRDLLKVHETGRTIVQGQRIIRIPPRPAWLIARTRFLNKLRTKQESKKMKKGITDYINKGRSQWFDEMIDIFYNKYKDLEE